MKVHVVLDQPDLDAMLMPADRTALRTAGVSRRQIKSCYEGTVRSVLRKAYPLDRFTVALRSHPSGTGPLLTKGRTSFPLTEKQRQLFWMVDIVFAAQVAQITMLFAVARKRAQE